MSDVDIEKETQTAENTTGFPNPVLKLNYSKYGYSVCIPFSNITSIAVQQQQAPQSQTQPSKICLTFKKSVPFMTDNGNLTMSKSFCYNAASNKYYNSIESAFSRNSCITLECSGAWKAG